MWCGSCVYVNRTVRIAQSYTPLTPSCMSSKAMLAYIFAVVAGGGMAQLFLNLSEVTCLL